MRSNPISITTFKSIESLTLLTQNWNRWNRAHIGKLN